MASGNGRGKVIASPIDVEMASVVVGNGSHAAMSLPVGMERGMAARPMIVPKSFQSQMSDMAGSSQQQPLLDGPSSEDEYDVVQRGKASLNPAAARKASYGATSNAGSRLHLPPRRRHRRHHSSSIISVASLDRLFGRSYERVSDSDYNEQPLPEEDEGSGDDDDDDGPPIIEMIYRRSCKDKTKLILLPLLYFIFMVFAGVFAFYSLSALVDSYKYRVRSVKDVQVTEHTAAGIAVFPETFGIFHECEFKYNDDLSPHTGNWSSLEPVEKCKHVNVTFFSQLIYQNRTAMVFGGPTQLKQSLALNFSVNTTMRQFGGMEFMLLQKFSDAKTTDAPQILARVEAENPLYTVPAGFRSWIKMSYILRDSGKKGSRASAEFSLTFDFSQYNDFREISDRTTDVVYVLFEWKSDRYEYITEILSTNVFNTVGSLAGIFVALIKAGEYCTTWVKRIRRERQKKLLRLQELEEQQRLLQEEYEERRGKKTETRSDT